MSLFTDPELPPPISANGNESTTSGSDEEMDILDRAETRRPNKRWFLFRMCSGTRGFLVLSGLTLVSVLTVLYAREHVQTFVAQAFSQNNYITLMSSWQMAPPQPAKAKAPPTGDQTPNVSLSVHSAEEGHLGIPEEYFPEEEQGLLDEDVSLLEEFRPMPDMTLHYLWCGNRFFDFRNYVAAKSAIEALQPKKIVFHYLILPMTDPDGYFTWFERLNSLYPRIILAKLNTTDQACYSGGFKRFALVFDILKRYGGIYMPEDAIFLRFADRFRHMGFVSGIASCNLQFFFEGIVIAKFGQFEDPLSETERVRMLSVCHDRQYDENSLRPCTPEERYLENAPGGHVPSCVRLETALFPKNVWDAHDKVSTLVKLIAYGKTDLRPRSNSLAMYRIPRLAHYLCTGGCALSFTAYLSILSALHVAGLEKVLVHGPYRPSGPWWDRLQTYSRKTIFYLRKDFNYHGNLSQHISNATMRHIMRTEILLHYGGVFHDGHVLWTQRLPDELLEYDTVISPDWHAYGNWPESVNHALVIARGGASYLQQLLMIFWDNIKSETPWVADHYLSYRLIELDPSLVYIHRHLQVKCLNHNCHPTWKPGYRSHVLLNRPGQAFDWRTETLSVHWQDTFQDLEVDQVKFTSGFIVDIAHNVLSAAGVDVNRL